MTSLSALRAPLIDTYAYYKEYLSAYLKHNQDYPRSIFLEVTPHCNLRCVFCPCYIDGEEVFRDRANKYMSYETFTKIIDHISGRFNFQICFTYSGEPLLNRDVFNMIAYLRERQIPSVMHSNALLLTADKTRQVLDAGLDRFIVSLDGASKQTYEDVRRGGDFNTVIANVKALLQERTKAGLTRPFVEMQFVVTSKNKHEVPAFQTLSRDLKVDYARTKTLLVFQDTQNQGYIEEVKGYFVEDEVARYNVEDGGLVLKDASTCPEIQNCIITVDGDVVMCCFDIHGKYKFGNCIETGLDEVWRAEGYTEFRRDVMAKRRLSICSFCNTSTHVSRDVYQLPRRITFARHFAHRGGR